MSALTTRFPMVYCWKMQCVPFSCIFFPLIASFNNTSCFIVTLLILIYLSCSTRALEFHSTIRSLSHLAKSLHNEYLCLMAHNSSFSLGFNKCNNGQRSYCSSIGIVSKSLESSSICFPIVGLFDFKSLLILLLVGLLEQI